MRLTAQLQLKPTMHQAHLLKATLERANAACNVTSEYAWEHRLFGHYALHQRLYAAFRAEFSLSAQMVVRCLAKVGDAYKLDRATKRTFQPHGAIAYDAHILKYRTDQQTVSIWTLLGRQAMPYVCGERQTELLAYQKGESDLVYRRGKFYLLATCDVPEPTAEQVDRFLGVDRGMVNLAADSEGNVYQGQRVEHRRQFYARRRQVLSKIGTKSAKRKLKHMRDKQAHFQKDVNHCIAKELVVRAKRTKQGIALEDLTGINLRTRVGHEHRAQRGNWSFDQLGQFIHYKARLYGVPIVEVDARYTSQRCAVCGHTEPANRVSQAEFLCRACGHSAHADVNAAVNIAVKAACQPASGLGGTEYRAGARDKRPVSTGSS